MVNIKTFSFNNFHECCTLVWDETLQAVIFDPGCCSQQEKEEIVTYIETEGLKPQMILLTHSHFDHIYGVKYLSDKYGIKVFLHPKDIELKEKYIVSAAAFAMPVPDNSFETEDVFEGQVLKFGNTEIEVIETPGHTQGGVCYHFKEERLLISGDTLFAGCIGRSDLPGGDYDQLIKGIMEKLMVLDGDTDIIPGHGHASNIAYERTNNPFLQPFNEPYEEGDE